MKTLIALWSRSKSGPLPRPSRVATAPGWSAFTVTPLPARRRASSRVNRMFAVFDWP